MTLYIGNLFNETSIRDDVFIVTILLSSAQRWLSQLLSLSKNTQKIPDTLAMVIHSKEKKTQVQQQHQQQNLDPENPETESCRSFCSALSRLFSLTCVIFLVFGFATLLSAIFWLFPPRRSLPRHHSDDLVHLNGNLLSTQVYLFFFSFN